MTFRDLEVPTELVAALGKQGITEPTPIQVAALPVLLAGKDAYLNAARDRIVCAAHGAQFDIATGICTLGPCLGQRLQPVALDVRHNEIYLKET